MHLLLLGYPLSHSVSPAMQAAALAQAGLGGWDYAAMPVPEERLAEAVALLRQEDYAGANITVPHKQAILPMLDGLTPEAERVGAVNTLFKQGRRLLGHNTDLPGLLADLRALGVDLAGRPALILGAGGAARAAVEAVRKAGAVARLAARRPEQARAALGQGAGEVIPWGTDELARAGTDCALLVNATPVGMYPDAAGCPWPEDLALPAAACVYDLVYNPPETRLLARARQAGLRAAGGLGMLVEQGALAFELWTGRPAPRDVMRAAGEGALSRSHWPSPRCSPVGNLHAD